MSSFDSSPCQVKLLPEVVVDLDDHGAAFGIAGLGPGLVVGFGAELPGFPAAQHTDADYLAAPARFNPTIAGREPVGNGSGFCM